ncbi:BamA/TamA family outer membrane protein [candidate division KSB1 bacterium]|nr:BamA/TamA family outer membrane protein [candidate division KSB1 bacterium]
MNAEVRSPNNIRNFYGLGNDAMETERTDYLEEETNVMGTFLFSPRQTMSFGLGFGYSDVAIEAGRDEGHPNLDSLFTPSQLPGFFGEKMGTVVLKLYRDARNEAGHPTRGGEQLLAVQFSRDGDLGFLKYTLDLRKYIELFYGRVLALRVRADLTGDLGDREVPFYRLPGLGGEDLLKGYQSFRFRDDDLAYASAEYRVPLNPMVYMTLFIEEGRVFRNIFKDFTLSDWHYSYGGGLRFRAPNGGLITTIIIARSDEGTRFLFGLNTELGGI